jgi:hypothetical protein
MKIKSWKVVIFSLLALGFIAITIITKEWLFLVPSIVLMILNQRELIKNKK